MVADDSGGVMKKWKHLYGLEATFVCPYCLKVFPIKKATIDHKNPYSRFHDNSPENKVISCKFCNNQKGALTVAEYELWKTTEDLGEWYRLEFIRNGGLSR